MTIAWGDIGLVLVVGLAAGAGIVTLFSLGLAVLAGNAPPAQRTAAVEPGTPSDTHDGPPLPGPHNPTARAVGWACVAVCALLVLYGIYLALPAVQKLF